MTNPPRTQLGEFQLRDQNMFQLRATKTIREGEAWSVSYGTNHVKQSNANLLTTYGFSLPNNQMHDYVVVIDEEGARRTQVN